ncbi:MAG: transglutaminase-like domain-containing protein [Pseudomonadota bacterium]
MRRNVTIDVPEATPEGAILIAPKPVAAWDQRFVGFDAGAAAVAEIPSTNSPQTAYALTPGDGPVSLSYAFEVAPGQPAAGDIWQGPRSALTRADPGLAALSAELCAQTGTTGERLDALVRHAAEMFDYDHPDERFNTGLDAVPTLCGTTRGSCVDINTFVLAGALSQGITGQYMAGYWFGPGRNSTPDMHCWLAFDDGDAPLFWDIAHHLKWGVDPLAPGLNPAGGRRVAMTAGRGLGFDTVNGPVTISHFSEPLWVLPDGGTKEPEIRISLEETSQ